METRTLQLHYALYSSVVENVNIRSLESAGVWRWEIEHKHGAENCRIRTGYEDCCIFMQVLYDIWRRYIGPQEVFYCRVYFFVITLNRRNVKDWKEIASFMHCNRTWRHIP
jgi:hypothetical protein